MTRKDYKRAAELVRSYHQDGDVRTAEKIEKAFLEFFAGGPNFDDIRFAIACEPKPAKRAS